MSEDEKFTLTRHGFFDHLKLMLLDLYTKESIKDVTLVCSDHTKLKAHSFMLKAHSLLFSDILDELKDGEKAIYLGGVSSHEMLALLEFMYLGEMTIQQERISDLMDIAKKLKIKEFTKESDSTEDQEQFIEDHKKESKQEVLGGETEMEDHSELKFEATLDISSEEPAHKEDVLKDQGSTTQSTMSDGELDQRTEETLELETSMLELSQNMTEEDEKLKKQIKISVKPRRSLATTQCPECGKIVNGKYYLEQHMKNKHTVHECEQCDFKVTNKTKLQTHVKYVHQGLKYYYEPVKCDQCGKMYKDKYSCKSHVKLVHEGLTQFSCEYCDYKAKYKQHLQTHTENVHLGIKHDCEYCGFSYTDISNMRAHYKKAHGTKYITSKSRKATIDNAVQEQLSICEQVDQ